MTVTARGGSIKAKVIRATRLDSCGNPIGGATGSIISAGFTKVDLKGQFESGTEFYVKNAWGDACINDLDATRLKRYDVEIDFCQVDPTILEITAGYRLITDANGNIVGSAISESPGSASNGSMFSLELWSKVSGNACAAIGGYKWIHWLIPAVQYARTSDLTFELNPLTMVIDANTTRNGNYGDGPYEQWVPVVGSQEHVLFQFSNTDPPAPPAAGGYTTVTLPTSTQVGTLSAALTTGAPITTIATSALSAVVPAGYVTVTAGDGSGNSQMFATAGAASGATAVPVTSTTPTYAFPAGSTVSFSAPEPAVG